MRNIEKAENFCIKYPNDPFFSYEDNFYIIFDNCIWIFNL